MAEKYFPKETKSTYVSNRKYHQDYLEDGNENINKKLVNYFLLILRMNYLNKSTIMRIIQLLSNIITLFLGIKKILKILWVRFFFEKKNL